MAPGHAVGVLREAHEDDTAAIESRAVVQTGSKPVVVAVVALLAVAAGIVWLISQGGEDELADARSTSDAPPPVSTPSSTLPAALLAAESYAAEPTAEHLRSLFSALGGFDGLEVARAEGAFDLVTFDPNDNNRLLATVRDGYGQLATNETDSELWTIAGDVVDQRIWSSLTDHDFVHFNPDGTITMWVLTGDPQNFSRRIAFVLDSDGAGVGGHGPLFPARFVAEGDRLFALVTSGDTEAYTGLIADSGSGQTRLAHGALFSWVDIPTPGVLVAHPADGPAGGATSVWDTQTLEPRPDHPLAGRLHRRVAVSGDGRIAVGVTGDGELEAIDLATGEVQARFGSVDSTGIERPIALSDDGSVAITVDHEGDLTIWFVPEGEVVASIDGEAAMTRWLPEELSSRLSSAVAPDASRIAVRVPARPQTPVSWTLLDTDVNSWIERACTQAGRSLTPDDQGADALPRSPLDVCG